MGTLSTEEESLLVPPPTRFLSSRRAERQALRAEKTSPVPSGFGRANRRHPDPRPRPDLEDEQVRESSVFFDIRRSGTKTTQLEAVCVTCGTLGTFPKRSLAINATGEHLQQEHQGMTGLTRRDIL